MTVKSKLRVILAVFLGMIVLETSMFALNLYQESRSVERGAERGFDLAGTYGYGGASQENDEDGSIRSASFVPDTSNDGQGSYQLIGEFDGDLGYRNGTFRRTFDPNVFYLYSEDGSHMGSAHLAYARPDGSGLIYLSVDGLDCSLSKWSATPGFVE